MPLADKLSQITALASWKVKQQSQIFHLQGLISELESQIGIQKTILAEQTYKLFEAGEISAEPLLPVCEKIRDLYIQKSEKQNELEIVRAENSPEDSKPSASEKPIAEPPAPPPSTEPPMEEAPIVIEKFDEDVPSEVKDPPTSQDETGWVETNLPS